MSRRKQQKYGIDEQEIDLEQPYDNDGFGSFYPCAINLVCDYWPNLCYAPLYLETAPTPLQLNPGTPCL